METTPLMAVKGRPGRRKGSGKRAGREADWGLRALQALADPSRWRIVRELSNGPRTLGDLATRVDLSAPCTSHHISILKEMGFVAATREARTVRCALVRDRSQPSRLLDLVLPGSAELPNVSNLPEDVPLESRKRIAEFLFSD